jgi:hypothetical protein
VVSDALGGTVGTRVASIVQRAITDTKIRLGPHQAAIAQTILADFTNHVSDEALSAIGPLLVAVGAHPELGELARPLVEFVGATRGQWQMFAATTTTGAALGGGIMNLLTNELNPAILPLIAANPHGIISAGDAAQAAVRQLADDAYLRGKGRENGMDSLQFHILRELSRTRPDPTAILELINRGFLSEEQGVAMMVSLGYSEGDQQIMINLRHYMIPIPDLSAMWNRSIIDDAQGAELAARWGVSHEDWARMMELGGEPLGAMDTLAALRRGIIDEARARRGIVQGPIRNEWFDVMTKLQYNPMSTTDAADAVNQGHMTLAQGQEIAKWNGLMPEHFATVIENAGIPPGVQFALDAWNRGFLTDAEFEQAFLESRLKNRYVPLYKQMRWRTITEAEVRRLYRLGMFNRAEADTRLGWEGFSPADRTALLDAEDLGTGQATKDLSQAQIVDLYTDRAIDQPTAEAMLGALGYSSSETAWLIMIADLRKRQRYVDAVISRVHAGYVAWRLDANSASSIMDGTQIPPDQRDELIGLWDLERLAVTKGLTAAQIKAAVKKGAIGQADALDRLTQQGYTPDDAVILLNI